VSWYVDCANCGRQGLIDGPGDLCYWCGKPADKKEVIMSENEIDERAILPKPKKRKDNWGYYEQNKEAILADYLLMKLLIFLERWHMTTRTWQMLKKKWEVKNKWKGSGIRKPKEDKPSTADKEVAPLTEHERYLLLLGWQQAVREILKSRVI